MLVVRVRCFDLLWLHGSIFGVLLWVAMESQEHVRIHIGADTFREFGSGFFLASKGA